jgi:hypothetical protein
VGGSLRRGLIPIRLTHSTKAIDRLLWAVSDERRSERGPRLRAVAQRHMSVVRRSDQILGQQRSLEGFVAHVRRAGWLPQS